MKKGSTKPDQWQPQATWLFRVLVRVMSPGFVRLRAWEQGASTRQKRWALLAFCAAFLALLGLSLRFGLHEVTAMRPAKLPVMTLPPEPNAGAQRPGNLQQLLDSIRARPGGDKILDSLQRSRPGLLDTLKQIDTKN